MVGIFLFALDHLDDSPSVRVCGIYGEERAAWSAVVNEGKQVCIQRDVKEHSGKGATGIGLDCSFIVEVLRCCRRHIWAEVTET